VIKARDLDHAHFVIQAGKLLVSNADTSKRALKSLRRRVLEFPGLILDVNINGHWLIIARRRFVIDSAGAELRESGRWGRSGL
jgi:hypothetical protein